MSSVCFGNAQQHTYYKWSASVGGGLLVYQGDLAPSAFGSYKTLKPALSVSVSRILNPYFSVKAMVVFGSLKGNDSLYKHPSWRQQRNFNFFTPLTEWSALFVWSPYGNNSNELRKKITPYLFAGAGISFVNISRDYSRFDTTFFNFTTKQQRGLATDIAKKLPQKLLVLPVGAGLSIYVSSRWSVNLETTFRYTFTDYLDGFSQAANPARKDFYQAHTAGVTYRFGKKDPYDCPVIKF
jgi:hypothetical protein